jgi:hypothetical protein
MRLSAVIVAVVVVVACAAYVARSSGEQHAGGAQVGLAADAAVRCPTVESGEAAPRRPLGLLRALPSEVRRVFHNFSSMGHPAWHGWVASAVVALDITETLPRLGTYAAYHRLAQHLCGRRVADASYAVELAFPNCQLPCSAAFVFMSKMNAGWRIWYAKGRDPTLQ